MLHVKLVSSSGQGDFTAAFLYTEDFFRKIEADFSTSVCSDRTESHNFKPKRAGVGRA